MRNMSTRASKKGEQSVSKGNDEAQSRKRKASERFSPSDAEGGRQPVAARTGRSKPPASRSLLPAVNKQGGNASRSSEVRSESVVPPAVAEEQDTSAEAASVWESLTQSQQSRMITFMGLSDGIFPPRGTPSLDQVGTALRAAQAWVNARTQSEALIQLHSFESLPREGSVKGSSRSGRSEAPSSAPEITGESREFREPFVAPLIPAAPPADGKPSDEGGRPADGAIASASVATQGKGADDKKPVGVGKYLWAWDTLNHDFREMVRAIQDDDMIKLEAAVTDHMGRGSLKLSKLCPRDRAEYRALKIMEVHLGLITEEMEDLKTALAEASVGSEQVARFVRERLEKTPAHPGYWKQGPGARLVTHVRGELLRLQVMREDPPGTWERLQAKVTELPTLSALGAKEREEARKQALKESKPSSSQSKANNKGAKEAGGAERQGYRGSSASRGSGAQAGSSERKCWACGEFGHSYWEGKCPEGRKRVEAQKNSSARGAGKGSRG